MNNFLIKWALAASLVLSFILLAVYLAGANYPDKTLFFLLWAIRILAFFVCVFSLYLLVFGVRQFVRNPAAAKAFVLVLYIFCILWGAGLIIFHAFITVIAGGYG